MTELFWCFSTDSDKQVECQKKLMQYQWDNFKERLNIPPEPKQSPLSIPVNTDMEGIELEKFISQAPSRRYD